MWQASPAQALGRLNTGKMAEINAWKAESRTDNAEASGLQKGVSQESPTSRQAHHHVCWLIQLNVLFMRAAHNVARNPLNTGARLMCSTFLGVFTGLVFLKLRSGRQDDCFTDTSLPVAAGCSLHVTMAAAAEHL